MKKLTAISPKNGFLEFYEKIRDKKHLKTRNRLIENHESISDRFDEYENKLKSGSLETLSASNLSMIKDELRSCYGNNKHMVELKELIKSSQPKGRLAWCPYCGATTPGSHDHYAPSEKFPEFSAHALNIIPSCTMCNSTKDDDWLDAGKRQYLHFYMDDIPDVNFLNVDLIIDNASRTVSALYSLSGLSTSNENEELLRVHFKKLKLLTLYNDRANDLIVLTLRSVRSHMRNGGKSASGFLINEAKENSDLYGKNNWRSVLFLKMSAEVNLSEWIDWV